MRHALVAVLLAACTSAEPTFTALDAPDDAGFDTAAPLPGLAPAPAVVLTVSPVVLGEPMTVTVSGAAPGAYAWLYGALQTSSTPLCPPLLAPRCLDLTRPRVLRSRHRTGPDGTASWELLAPATAPAGTPGFQVAIAASGRLHLSNVVEPDLLAPEGDADLDGVTNRDEVRAGLDPQDPDSDADGCDDGADDAPLDPSPDSDGDGAADCADACPADPAKLTPGACGCGTPDTDSDRDGLEDCLDACPLDPAKITPGTCGCGTPDTDTDGDDTPDCDDACPLDPAKLDPGACGCGTPDSDRDGDGVADCVDVCPTVSDPDQIDSDGDGVGDACTGTPAWGLDSRPANPTCVNPTGTFPDRLSQTGCFDPTDPTKPLPGLIPFDVQVALWTDGAGKGRWLAIPDGTSITVDPVDGDFVFPIGSVLVKTFERNGVLLETRLFVRKSDGTWAGQGYAWDLARTDARKTSGTVTIGPETWTVPSGNDCLKCHTPGAKGALGPEVVQLNAERTYSETGRTANQLLTLEHIGVIDTLPAHPDDLDVLPRLSDVLASLEDRSRAYLHANCAGCHRPDQTARWDARWTTPFAQQGLCNVTAGGGKLFVAPGDASASELVIRLESTKGNRMPPLGTDVVDAHGVGVIRAWIDGLTGCP